MVIDVTLFVTEVYQAPKRHYVTGAVVGGQGGMLKIALEGQAKEDLKAGAQVHFKGMCKPNVGDKGLYLQYVG